jgi:hypothetical protein
MVDAIALEAISLTRIAGSSPADRIASNPREYYHMAKEKVTPKKPTGPKPETLTVEGDWKDAVKHAMKRGKPPKPKSE